MTYPLMPVSDEISSVYICKIYGSLPYPMLHFYQPQTLFFVEVKVEVFFGSVCSAKVVGEK